MTYFMKSGSRVSVADSDDVSVTQHIPTGNYVINENQMGGLYLEQVDGFELPERVYGSTQADVDRIITTFSSRKASTGVLLSGEKGSGKTLTAKMVSAKAAKFLDMPTILVNQAWTGEQFSAFIQRIGHPCVILFDEFEKVYRPEAQEGLLTLLDGVFQGRFLFIFVCNDKWRISSLMANRPGRVYYHLEYGGVSREFIEQYCEDRLEDKTQTAELVKVSNMFCNFNFDMLQAFVEEMNRYDIGAWEATRYLNARPHVEGADFEIELKVKGTKKISSVHYEGAQAHPLRNHEFHMNYRDANDNWCSIKFSTRDLESISPLRFANSQGEVTFRRKEYGPAVAMGYGAFIAD